MSRLTKIEPIEIKEFLSQLIRQIEDGVDIETRYIVGNIDVEVSVEKVSHKDGNLKIYVASGTAGTSTNQIAKAKFSVQPRLSEKQKREIGETILSNKNDYSGF